MGIATLGNDGRWQTDEPADWFSCVSAGLLALALFALGAWHQYQYPAVEELQWISGNLERLEEGKDTFGLGVHRVWLNGESWLLREKCTCNELAAGQPLEIAVEPGNEARIVFAVARTGETVISYEERRSRHWLLSLMVWSVAGYLAFASARAGFRLREYA